MQALDAAGGCAALGKGERVCFGRAAPEFQIEEMRRVGRLTGREKAIFHGCGDRCAEKDFKQGRSVDDDHLRSRPARTASAGGTEGSVSARLRKRARNSSIVGRSAA